MGLDVVEGVGLPSTTTSIRCLITIDKLLLREAKKLSSLDKVMTFNSSSGRERPARSTLSLVLDGVDCTLGSPVDFGGEVARVNESWGNVLLVHDLGSEESLVFISSPGGELVVSDGESVGLVTVDHLVFGILRLEDGQSEGVFLLGSV